jgi:hypothetical protein
MATAEMRDVLTVHEAADLTGLHPQTLRKRVREGVVPAKKLPGTNGPQWMIERNALLPLVDDPESDSSSRSDSRSSCWEAALAERDEVIEQLRTDLRRVRRERAEARAKLEAQGAPDPDAEEEGPSLTRRCLAILAPMTGGASSPAAEQAISGAMNVHRLAREVLPQECAALVTRWQEEGDRVKLWFLPGNVGRACRWLEKDLARGENRLRRSGAEDDAQGGETALGAAVASVVTQAKLRPRWVEALQGAIDGPDPLRDEAQAVELLQVKRPMQTEMHLPAKWLQRVCDEKCRRGRGPRPVSDWSKRAPEPVATRKATAAALLDIDPEDDPFGTQ